MTVQTMRHCSAAIRMLIKVSLLASYPDCKSKHVHLNEALLPTKFRAYRPKENSLDASNYSDVVCKKNRKTLLFLAPTELSIQMSAGPRLQHHNSDSTYE